MSKRRGGGANGDASTAGSLVAISFFLLVVTLYVSLFFVEDRADLLGSRIEESLTRTARLLLSFRIASESGSFEAEAYKMATLEEGDAALRSLDLIARFGFPGLVTWTRELALAWAELRPKLADAQMPGFWRGLPERRTIDALLGTRMVLGEWLRSVKRAFLIVMVFCGLVFGGGVAATVALHYRYRVSRLREHYSRSVAKSALAAEEATKRGMARELHDDVAQDIAAARMLCERAAAAAQPLRESSESTETGLGFSERAAGILRESGAKLRAICRDLRPPELEEFGLGVALEELCVRSGAWGIPVEFALEGSVPRFLEETEIHAFRIAQEALTNGLKHAGATRLNVRLVFKSAGTEGRRGILRLEVSDDGRGMEPSASLVDEAEKGRVEGGMGLSIMRERAALCSGELQVESGTSGTTIRLHIPAATARPGRS